MLKACVLVGLASANTVVDSCNRTQQLVVYSLKPIKLLAQQVSTLILFQ